MSGLALSIVLMSALLHAVWNYCTKKSLRKVVFVWWALLAAIFLFFPMFLYWFPSSISLPGWYCIFASGLLHTIYFGLLGSAYERGDLSLVYPICRGSGPLFVPIFAMILIHEHVAPLGAAGIVLVVSGIYTINLQSFSARAFLQPFIALRGGASLWAMFTGVAITLYSLVDKVGVGQVFPPVYLYLMLVVNWVALSAYVVPRQRAWIKREWIVNWKTIFIVGFLSNFTYLIILFAMQISKVSYVVAVREVSIVFSAAIGVLWLGERNARQKLIGAVIITCGVILIGLSR
jgi:drug/metabolite transporter (DMT)-like permease